MELISAAKDGNFEVAFSLITSGADLNTRDKDRATPLYWSACRGNAPLCEVLIQAGCDVNARVKWGSTALHAAVDRGQFPCVEILVAWGADINAQNNRGDTPLHISAYRGFQDIIRHLVRAGANVLLRNEKDKTPQEEAAAGGHDQAAKYLLSVMEELIMKRQNQLKSTIAGYDQVDGPKHVPGHDAPQLRYTPVSNDRQGMFKTATYQRSSSPGPTAGSSKLRFEPVATEVASQRKTEIENGVGHDSGVFHQDLHGHFDSVDGVKQNCSDCNGRNTLTPPINCGRPPVYRRSVSAQENGSNSRLNNLHATGRNPTNFAGMLYNVPPELVSESEDATNSFDSSYMSSTSDTSGSFNTSLDSSRVADEGCGATSRSHFTVRNQPDRWSPYKSSAGTNEVVVGLAEELTGCKQENKRLNMDKTVLENKVISQQNVIKEISKENISLKKDLHERHTTENEEIENKMHEPMTTHVELNKLLKKTKSFGMSAEEKENLHRELQAYIKENILDSTHDVSTPLDTPGREWTPGIDYVILGDKPINKVHPGQKQRSLVFLIKHLKTGRKLVLKIMVNLLNMNYQAHGDGFSMSTYLNETFSPGHSVPEQLLEHAGVLKILHHFEGSTHRFKKFVNMLVNQTADVPFEMATRSSFLVMDYFPQTLEEFICDLNLTNSDGNYGSLITFLTMILYQLLSLLHFIQDKNIAHRNTMCKNIFIDNNLCPKLGGFGVACYLNGSDGEPLIFSSKMEVHAGNDCAWAPELVHYYNNGPTSARQIYLKDVYCKSDVFALGQVFYSLLTRSTSECFYVNRLRSPHIKLPTLPSSLPAALRHVIGQMEAENPAQRFTAKQAMQRVGMILFPPTEKDVKYQEDGQSYCSAKLLQILATESCCFRMPEPRERLSPEKNMQLLRPRLEAHFLCNTSPTEFWEILQEFRNLNIALM